MPKMRLNLVWALDRVGELEKENAKFREEQVGLLHHILYLHSIFMAIAGRAKCGQESTTVGVYAKRIAELEKTTGG